MQRDIRRFSSTLLTTASICVDYRFHKLFDGNLMACHCRSARKLSALCVSNGGLFIKAAQHLSAMDYLLPKPYVRELSRLHDSAASNSIEIVEKVFKEELGMNLDQVFSEVCEIPIGSASIGQVHFAKLKATGEEVALKIQHPNIKKDSQIDLWTFGWALKIIKFLFPSFDFDWLIDELKESLSSELNFKKEAENAKITREIFENNPKFCKIVQIPKVFDKLTTERVLTMQYLPGFKINDIEALNSHEIDLKEVKREIFEIFMQMIFKHQFVHCDPHPGNILINLDADKNIKIIILDHGLYKNIPSDVVKTFSKLFLAILSQNEIEIKEISNELNIPSEVLFQILNVLQAISLKKYKNRSIAFDASIVMEFLNNQSDDSRRQTSNAIRSLPREILFLIKILNVLRSNERQLTIISNTINGSNNAPLIPVSLMLITGHCMSVLNPNYSDNNDIWNTLNVYMKLFSSYSAFKASGKRL